MTYEANWRGKCEKIERILRGPFQSRKEMHDAIEKVRRILQRPYDGRAG